MKEKEIFVGFLEQFATYIESLSYGIKPNYMKLKTYL